MARTTFFYLNPTELNYYPFMISPNKHNGSCNVDDLSMKICVACKTKKVNVTVFNTVTGICDAKALIKHISCCCKCRFNSTTCN